MINELYVHIGIHKTGSTALQIFLLNNSKFLKNFSCFYPRNGISFGPGHANIAFQILKNEKYYNNNATSLDDIVSELKASDMEKAILSSEIFCQFNGENVVEFKEALDFVENIKIICFVRRQDELFYSWWQESVKHGSIKDFNEAYFLFEKIFDYNKIIKPWADVFGNKNISIIFFPEQRDSNWSVAHEFFKVFDLPSEVTIPNGNVITIINKSLDIVKAIWSVAHGFFKIFYLFSKVTIPKGNEETKINKSLDIVTAMLLKNMNRYIANREDYVDLRNNFISTINEYYLINKIKPDQFKLSDKILTKIEKNFNKKNKIFNKNKFHFEGNKNSILYKNK